jgi:hypothetical protein
VKDTFPKKKIESVAVFAACLSSGHEEGGSECVRNVSKLLPEYTVAQAGMQLLQ